MFSYGMSSHGKAVAEWSGWHVPSGPGPVLQGSLGTARRGLLRLVMFGYVVATQGSHVLARPGWSCRVGETQGSRGTA